MNPFACYILSFVVALAVYGLNWSSSYPRLTPALGIFLMTTIAAHAILAYGWKKKTVGWKDIRLDPDKNVVHTTIFIYVLWAADFIYEGGVPLFKILFNQPYNYRLFGVPSLHVFTVTFSSFYTVYLFHLYLSTKKRLYGVLYLIHLAAAILIYSRAMFFFNLSSSAVLLLFSMKRLPRMSIAMVPFVMVLTLYLFGVLGNLRVSREARVPYDNTRFLRIGGATDSFRESFVPNEFFWSYIYLTSTIANLQQNIRLEKPPPVTFMRLISFSVNELTFDFISKRLNKALHLDPGLESRIPGPFNVSTVYSRSFSYLGWVGMTLIALFVLVVPGLYLKMSDSQSPFFLTGTAILCTVFLFMVYDNTIRFTGLGFQLFYPLFFGWLKKKQLFSLNNDKTTQ